MINYSINIFVNLFFYVKNLSIQQRIYILYINYIQKYLLNINSLIGDKIIKMLAPMAGITDGNFALKLIPYGFDVVSIGGYNTDFQTIAAGKKILERGRNEFDIEKENLPYVIKKEIRLIKNKYPRVKISLNLRAAFPDSIINLVNIVDVDKIDIIEINSHCKQEELLKIGCGQEMLHSPNRLGKFIKKVVNDLPDKKVSIKVRSNVKGVDDLNIAKIIEKVGADYLHIDAMKPGCFEADLNIITKIANETDIFIIGNNSITNSVLGKKMINAGASGVSIAREAINGKLNFDISKI